ncbi:MAG TPA: GMC family oxidoreductase [Dehalococcoidia bacterium]|nr:GMC family oxidoreductase [Dehalococcoidia bacterium]
MIVDALELADGTLIESDVCIVGAGPAGITLARELLGESFRVCLLESVGLDFEPQTEALKRLSNVGGDLEPPTAATRRQFGGAANAWDVLTTEAGGGVRYLPLSAVDFEKRDWLPHSGWPFTKAEIDPFYERAQRVCDIGPYTYRVEDWTEPDARPWPLDEARLTTSVEQYGHHRVFTRDHLEELRRSPNLNLVLHANVTSIEQRPGSAAVERIAVACVNGCRHSVTASLFVLATGGIENARLLLLSTAQQPNGLGNQHDLVGRFFMDHHNVDCGELVPASPELLERSALYDLRRVNGAWVMAKLNIAEALMREERLLNGAARIEARLDPGLEKALRSLARAARAVRRGRLPDDIAAKVREVVPQLPRLAAIGGAAFKEHGVMALARQENRGRYGWSKRSGQWRSFASFSVELQTELAPDPANRVVLGDDRDAFGRPLAGVYWKWGETDRRSLRRVQELLVTAFADSGLGVLRLPAGEATSNVTSPAGIFHHMGTTRMHADPARGVVDADCRVHGVENLFVAGSSVFPTGGYANPTLTIVALSIRLADQIKALMRSRRIDIA